MSDTDALWKRVDDAFKDHRIRLEDQTPQVNLNRIAAKCIGIRFDSSNCTVHEEWLSPDELRRLKRFHDDNQPSRDWGSIVVLVYKGERVVIDGNKRVNKWVNEESTVLRSALIIEPHGASPKPRPGG